MKMFYPVIVFFPSLETLFVILRQKGMKLMYNGKVRPSVCMFHLWYYST